MALILGALFATMAFALKDDAITIQFYNSGNNEDKSRNEDAIVDGELIQKGISEGKISLKGGQTLKLPTGTADKGYSFSWHTDDGQAWEGGTTVTFYESTNLYPITAVDIYTFDDLCHWVKAGSEGKGGCSVRLMDDIEVTKQISFAGGEMGYESHFLLNGYKITISSDLDQGWGGNRHGSHFYGTGTIEYLGDGIFTHLNGHGTGGEHCQLTVGRGVTINAPNATLVRDGDQGFKDGYPKINIYGTVNCKNILKMDHGNNRNPKIYIHNTAKLILNDAIVWNKVTGNTVYVIVNGGTIFCTSGTVSLFNDSSTIYQINGGAFRFSLFDDKKMLPKKIDSTKYKVTELSDKRGTTYQMVVDNGCSHDYKYVTTIEAS